MTNAANHPAGDANHQRDPLDSEDESVAEQRAEANLLIGAGATVGAVGLAGGLLLGSVCPVCIVATPALLGAGAYKRLKARRRARRS